MQVVMQVQTDNGSLQRAGAALATALLARGHDIPLVYFHDDGVRVVEPAVARLWSKVADAGGALLICSTGLTHRDIDPEQVPGDFQPAGLAQFFDQALTANRCITIR